MRSASRASHASWHCCGFIAVRWCGGPSGKAPTRTRGGLLRLLGVESIKGGGCSGRCCCWSICNGPVRDVTRWHQGYQKPWPRQGGQVPTMQIGLQRVRGGSLPWQRGLVDGQAILTGQVAEYRSRVAVLSIVIGGFCWQPSRRVPMDTLGRFGAWDSSTRSCSALRNGGRTCSWDADELRRINWPQGGTSCFLPDVVEEAFAADRLVC